MLGSQRMRQDVYTAIESDSDPRRMIVCTSFQLCLPSQAIFPSQDRLSSPGRLVDELPWHLDFHKYHRLNTGGTDAVSPSRGSLATSRASEAVCCCVFAASALPIALETLRAAFISRSFSSRPPDVDRYAL